MVRESKAAGRRADMEQNEEPESIVVLRRWGASNGGGIIALFPNERDRGYVNSYEHVGQHGDASYPSVIDQTRPVAEADPEAQALLAELRMIGYNPVVRRRRPRR
jgi:hypothetical protein